MASKAESADVRVVRWRSGTVVSVSRLPAPGQVMGRALGIGELLDPVDVGRAVRIRLDAGRALAPTEVTRIESVSRDVIRLDTRNHRYELRRIEASPSTIGVMSIHDAGAPRPNEGVGLDATQVVSVEAWGETRPGRFESGARVRVTRTRDGETRVYPPATLLVDLAPGEEFSFAIEEGVIGTSSVLSLTHRSPSCVEVVTRNSRYELELVSDAEDAS